MYQVPGHCQKGLEVFDTLRQRDATLVDEVRREGSYSAELLSTEPPSGAYVLRLLTGRYLNARQPIVLRDAFQFLIDKSVGFS